MYVANYLQILEIKLNRPLDSGVAIFQIDFTVSIVLQ